MRRYQTNRVKLAGKITRIDGYVLHVDWHPRSIVVDNAYLRKHQPYVGGYFIEYEDDDGYRSFCPADVFESSHTEVHTEAEVLPVDTQSGQPSVVVPPMESEEPSVQEEPTFDAHGPQTKREGPSD